ncbi:glycosyltransferase family 71 protein [Xylona heveae TC161]|uniref:Glycosyltransferase family 71 protein n=1 Tax=Xylona heveae (strain CBS 132557 / TC161) TaxID=1328760 RepID=A0A165IJP7_XYLHT|nr:glycosyltransferase family 71 protein [Xylona heveae TC161]KZF24991.1 glycosyltransferase family 71 protein [Xylona heveae TC161]
MFKGITSVSGWSVPPVKKKALFILAAIAFLLLIPLTPLYPDVRNQLQRIDTISTDVKTNSSASPVDARLLDFWRSLAESIAKAAPQCEPPRGPGSLEVPHFDISDDSKHRPDVLEMPSEDVHSMFLLHNLMVKEIEEKFTSIPYVAGTRGIVCLAGGKYMPPLIASLRMLRRTGSNLPVEVFTFSLAEHEPYLCDEVLPSLNAKCVALSPMFDQVQPPAELTGWQLKVFSILFSSFEDVLFLDADNVALKDPEELFSSNVYAKYGLLSWPDFWLPSESSQYFAISGQEASDVVEHAARESGELLVSKKSHAKSLALAAYYNVYGPDYYYVLISQFGPGMGDKDTFTAAAEVFGEPVYFLDENARVFGSLPEKAGQYYSIIQYDPTAEYLGQSKSPLFMHINQPVKMNIKEIIGHHSFGFGMQIWGSAEEAQEMTGVSNLPLALCEELIYSSCNVSVYKDWSKAQQNYCDAARHHCSL